jgi:hypothetical protein
MRSTLARVSPVLADLASAAVTLCESTSSTARSHTRQEEK